MIKYSFETFYIEEDIKETVFHYGNKTYRSDEYFISGDDEICVDDRNEWHNDIRYTGIFLNFCINDLLENFKGEINND